MNEELNLISNLYNKVYDKQLQVYEVFKDYFDEENVDIQTIPNVNRFKINLSRTKYSRYLTKGYILNNEKYDSLDDITKSIIQALLSAGVMSAGILECPTAFKYLYPFLYDVITPSRLSASIYVHFPEVRITNENDKYVDIKDLYARVIVTPSGKISGTFELNRTDYPVSHLMSNYMHSHISSVPLSRPELFESPCLGRGPINNTILSLVNEFDLSLWMLFCHELNTYVKVESLSGGPYHRLENIVKVGLSLGRNSFSLLNLPSNINYFFNTSYYKNLLVNFIRYILMENIIKFNYSNKCCTLAMSYLDYNIAISNAFIKFINTRVERDEVHLAYLNLQRLLSKNILKKAVIRNRQIFNISSLDNSRIEDYLSYNNKESFKFKGETLKLHIYNDLDSMKDYNTVLLLNEELTVLILMKIITYLNICYGNESTSTETRLTEKYCIL